MFASKSGNGGHIGSRFFPDHSMKDGPAWGMGAHENA